MTGGILRLILNSWELPLKNLGVKRVKALSQAVNCGYTIYSKYNIKLYIIQQAHYKVVLFCTPNGNNNNNYASGRICIGSRMGSC